MGTAETSAPDIDLGRRSQRQPVMQGSEPDSADVAAMRRFNRFYTKQIGVLNEGILQSEFSLAEVRVMYEISHSPGIAAVDLAARVDLDAGYLSRILRRLQKTGLIRRRAFPDDGRRSLLGMTEKGRKKFAALDVRQNEAAATLLIGLGASARLELVKAFATVERLLGGERGVRDQFSLRHHRSGDMGWITFRHGVLYAIEYGYDERFEAMVAEIAADFVKHFQPARERCWIAERLGQTVGSAFVTATTKETAQLRLLYVEPNVRRLGIGRRLVDECIGFARNAGYRRLSLWKQREQVAAQHVYERAGFHLVDEAPHRMFTDHEIVGETWMIDL